MCGIATLSVETKIQIANRYNKENWCFNTSHFLSDLVMNGQVLLNDGPNYDTPPAVPAAYDVYAEGPGDLYMHYAFLSAEAHGTRDAFVRVVNAYARSVLYGSGL